MNETPSKSINVLEILRNSKKLNLYFSQIKIDLLLTLVAYKFKDFNFYI
jgi:hypothetical protein